MDVNRPSQKSLTPYMVCRNRRTFVRWSGVLRKHTRAIVLLTQVPHPISSCVGFYPSCSDCSRSVYNCPPTSTISDFAVGRKSCRVGRNEIPVSVPQSTTTTVLSFEIHVAQIIYVYKWLKLLNDFDHRSHVLGFLPR